MIPFLDHILLQRFGEIHQKKIKLLGLIPSIAVTYPAASIEDVGELYRGDLPVLSLLSTEFQRWKGKFAALPAEERPTSLQHALLQCDGDSFPNIEQLLLIACTLPVTTCENERSNSQLKLLKTYLRSTMAEERLSGHAMMKIHRRRANELNLDTS